MLRLHARVADLRADLLHNASAHRVQAADLIAIEDLNVTGMVKNRLLAQAIGDAKFGELRRQIASKADWSGREVVDIGCWTAVLKGEG